MSNLQQNTRLPEKFLTVLAEEIKISEQMLHLLGGERQALVDMDMQTLIALSRKKEAMVTRLQGLDNALQEMAGKFIGNPSDKIIKLSSLMPLLDMATAQRLNALREKLASLREQILSRNTVNKGFALETKNFLSDAISTITNLVAERPTYARSKALNKPSTNLPSFVSREV
jgi:hypothetical protein